MKQSFLNLALLSALFFTLEVASAQQLQKPNVLLLMSDDLAATLYHLLGINPDAEIIDRNNRPLAISGKPVLDVIA